MRRYWLFSDDNGDNLGVVADGEGFYERVKLLMQEHYIPEGRMDIINYVGKDHIIQFQLETNDPEELQPITVFGDPIAVYL